MPRGKFLQCPGCPYSTTQKSKYEIHKMKHDSCLPFNCDICDYQCTSNSALVTHKRSHTKEKPFLCVECGYTCAQLSQLQQHNRIHTGERPYSCDLCDYRARQLSALQAHQRKHAGVKPYACNWCDYTATQLSSLQGHVKSKHTGESANIPVFYCPKENCKYSTHRSYLLKRHVKDHGSGDVSLNISVTLRQKSQKGRDSIFNSQLKLSKIDLPLTHSRKRKRPRKSVTPVEKRTRVAKQPVKHNVVPRPDSADAQLLCDDSCLEWEVTVAEESEDVPGVIEAEEILSDHEMCSD